ncbi:MAG: hypothetical protein JWP96_2195 [Polaromonas sp.]|nr:hypothetical protein [Polaromonas sp.]
MKFHRTLLALLASCSVQAMAAVSADEAKQLGTTLTEFGAIKAGNAEGTIPPYTGPLKVSPPGFVPGSGRYVDPFKDDKPLFRINASNVDKYADKLSQGQKDLLQKYPASYYIDVYPSRRTAGYPDKVLKATVQNATGCKTLKEGLAVDLACRGGLPFPIPKTGYEQMWNHQLRYRTDRVQLQNNMQQWVVDSAGSPVMTAQQKVYTEQPYYQVNLTDRDPMMISRIFSATLRPTRKAGEVSALLDYIDPIDKERRAYSYTTGQRRVKLAPEFSYDTPISNQGGVMVFDEFQLYQGVMDRFDFKLVGKKEMFLPYNTYKSSFECSNETYLMPSHGNPACERWELHRAWVVEAKLKPGNRHIYSRRTYFLDEDQTGAGVYDSYDHTGRLYRALFLGQTQLYDIGENWSSKMTIYDFNKGIWGSTAAMAEGTLTTVNPLSEREMAIEQIVGRETAR